MIPDILKAIGLLKCYTTKEFTYYILKMSVRDVDLSVNVL